MYNDEQFPSENLLKEMEKCYSDMLASRQKEVEQKDNTQLQEIAVILDIVEDNCLKYQQYRARKQVMKIMQMSKELLKDFYNIYPLDNKIIEQTKSRFGPYSSNDLILFLMELVEDMLLKSENLSIPIIKLQLMFVRANALSALFN